MMIVGLVLAAMMIDGADAQLLSFVSPVIMTEWGVGETELGPAMAAAALGMALGAGLGGWAGDRFGVKKTLFWTLILFGGATAGAAWSNGLGSMVLLRFIAGIGFGAAGPCGVALVVDWVPSWIKMKVTTLLSIGQPLGGALGALAIGAALPVYGWRWCFAASGVGAIVVALLVSALLPESLSYLIRTGDHGRARSMLLRFAHVSPDLSKGRRIEMPPSPKSGWRALKIPAGYGRLAAGTMVTYFCVSFVSFAFASWAPVFLTSKGFTISQALGASFAYSILGVVGALASGFLIAWTGSRKLLLVIEVLMLICAVIAGYCLAVLDGPPDHFTVITIQAAIGGTGGFAGMAIATLWTIMAHGYPSFFRSTGLGLGMTMGRLGVMAILLGGGALITLGGGTLIPFFATLSAMIAVAIIAGLLVNGHVPARSKDFIP